MKRRKGILLLIIVALLLGTTTAYAKISIDKCSIVTNASALDRKHLTAYQIHQGKTPVTDDYKCWVSTDGGMYWLHETWTCSKCGNFIVKDTYMGSITDTLKEKDLLQEY